MYMRLSTDTALNSGNCPRHFSRNWAIVSPFLHCKHIRVQYQSPHHWSTKRKRKRKTNRNDLPMTIPIPETISHLNFLFLHFLLHVQPFLPQFIALFLFGVFSFSIWEEVGVDVWVLAEFGSFGRSVWFCFGNGVLIKWEGDKEEVYESQKLLTFWCIFIENRSGSRTDFGRRSGRLLHLILFILHSERQFHFPLLLLLLDLLLCCSTQSKIPNHKTPRNKMSITLKPPQKRKQTPTIKGLTWHPQRPPHLFSPSPLISPSSPWKQTVELNHKWNASSYLRLRQLSRRNDLTDLVSSDSVEFRRGGLIFESRIHPVVIVMMWCRGKGRGPFERERRY